MSAAWKTFVVFNYIGGLAHGALFITLLWFAISNGLTQDDLSYFIPVVSGLFLMLVNYVTNLSIYYRCYPDKPFSKNRRIMYRLLTVFFCTCMIALILLVTFGIIQESSPDNERSNTGLVLLAILIPLALISVYVFVKQVTLLKYLRRNYEERMQSQISGIGASLDKN